MGDIASIAGLLLVFTLVGGFFAAAEVSLVAMRDSQVARLAESAGRRGRRLAALTAEPNRYLAAVQIGVTLAGFLSAGFGASQIVPLVSPTLQNWGVPAGLSDTLSFIGVTILIAYLSLVLGELVPKRLALQRAETVALTSAPIIDVTASIARPFIWLLSVSTNAVVRLLGGNPDANREAISGEELRGIVASQESLTPEERELIDEVFSVGRRELSEVMIPRTEVVFLDADTPLYKAARTAAALPHSRYPVIDGTADDVIGFVHVRDLLAPDRVDRGLRVETIVRQVYRLPDSLKLIPALNQMREQRAHLAIVIDEYGGTAGIVTMEDLVEELVGEIEDEYDQPTAESVNGTEVDGLLNVSEFTERTGIDIPDGPYETVGGFIMASLGRIPAVGDRVDFDGGQLEVIALEGRRVARLAVTVPPSEPTNVVPSQVVADKE